MDLDRIQVGAVEDLLRQRGVAKSRKQYDDLFNQASKAQIPVLNWNRFQVLTGTNTR